MFKSMVKVGLLSLVTCAAGAAESGWYAGVTAGQGMYDIEKDDLDELALFIYDNAGATVLSAESDLDDKGFAWSVFGGYQFTKYFAAELGYADVGSAKYHAEGLVIPPGGVSPEPDAFNADLSAKGPTLAAVGTLPLNDRFSLQGRAGLFFADTTIEFDGGEVSENSNDVFLGIGAAFEINPRLSLSLNFVHYKDVGDEDETGEADVNVVNLALTTRL